MGTDRVPPNAACKPSSQSLGYLGTPIKSEGLGKGHETRASLRLLQFSHPGPIHFLISWQPVGCWEVRGSLPNGQTKQAVLTTGEGRLAGPLWLPSPCPSPWLKHLSGSTQLAPYILRESGGTAEPFWSCHLGWASLALGRWIRGMIEGWGG